MKNKNFKFFMGLLLAVGFILFCLSSGIAYYQDEETVVIGKEEKAFAKKSLDEYVKNFLSDKNAPKFGFRTLGQAQGATLGEPYRLMIIELKNLKAYQTGMPVKGLLTDPQILWYPVMVNNEVTTKLEIIKKAGRLIAGEFGKIKIVQEISAVRGRLAGMIEEKTVKPPEEEMLIEISELRAMFIYFKNADGEFLIPSMIQPQRFELENGQVYPALELLLKLSEIAKKIEEKKIG
jgi:hypothetical protein